MVVTALVLLLTTISILGLLTATTLLPFLHHLHISQSFEVPRSIFSNEMASGQMRAGGVPVDARTSDYYRTDNIPDRFENPDVFKGYGTKPQHAMYTTESSRYGSKPPSVHTVPLTFHAKSQKFSEHLGKCGMPRNFSLNTSADKSFV